MRGRLMGGLALLLATTAMAPLAYAQAAEPAADGYETVRDVDSIVVVAPRFVPSGAITASKTTAPLIETPQSVSVISRDQIDLLNFVDVQQAVRYTAGVVGEAYGPDVRFDFLTLRGFIPVQYIDGLQAPVSSTIVNVGAELYGAEAIDILKGPASVLYGSSPPGGIYNLTSRRPSSRTGGELQVRYGNNDNKQAAGTVTGALADGLSARLTGLYRDTDTQVDFVNVRRAYIAPAVTYELGSNTKITALARYQWDKVEGDTNGFYPANGVLFDNPVGKVRRSVNLGEPDYNFYRRKQWGVGYELTHRFSPNLRFTQNTRWDEYHEYQQIIYAAGLGADNRTVSRFNFPFKDDVAQFAIDSRFDANVTTGAIEHRILFGLDYRNYREASAFAFLGATNIDLFNPVYSTTPIAAPTTLSPSTDQRLRQTGLYVQDQARIGNVILTASGRQDWVKLDKNGPFDPIRLTKQDKFTWRVGATYLADNGVAPYISYATSFQPIVGQTFRGEAFRPTVGSQVEAGVKYDGRTLSDEVKIFATGAVFRIQQTNVLTLDTAAGVTPGSQVQTGEVISKGLELEVVTRIREQLSVNASYTYTDATVSKSNNPGEVGARLAATPRNKATIFVDYTVANGAFAGLGGGLGVRYLSDSPGVLRSAIGGQTYVSPSTTLVDAMVHYDMPGWRLALNATNLFDKVYAGRCTGPTNCFFGQSRQVLATVTKRF